MALHLIMGPLRKPVTFALGAWDVEESRACTGAHTSCLFLFSCLSSHRLPKMELASTVRQCSLHVRDRTRDLTDLSQPNLTSRHALKMLSISVEVDVVRCH